MPWTKVTRNRQVTIPAEIARVVGISEGDILDVKVVKEQIVFEKAKRELPTFRIGRKIQDKDIEELIAESAAEVSG